MTEQETTDPPKGSANFERKSPWHAIRIGSVVHLVGGGPPGKTKTMGFHEGLHLAAIVTLVHKDHPKGGVSLTVLPPGSRDQFFAPVLVEYSDGKEAGTWHWPEGE